MSQEQAADARMKAAVDSLVPTHDYHSYSTNWDGCVVAGDGFEPSIYGLWARRSNHANLSRSKFNRDGLYSWTHRPKIVNLRREVFDEGRFRVV